jgi:O-antigen ligase
VGTAATLLVALVLIGLPFEASIANRFTSNDYGSAHSRIALAQMAKGMIRDHPIFGVGANNYALVLPRYETAQFGNAWHYTVHDKYLLVWAETGAIGLAAFLAFLLVTLKRGWSIVRTKDRLLGPIALGLSAGLCGQLAHMFVDIFHGRSAVQALWVVAALLAAMRLLTLESAR